MKIGIQMYSVRNELAKDPAGTMRKVAQMGYKSWETYPFDTTSRYNNGIGLDVGEGKSLLKELGVNVFAAHLNYLLFKEEEIAPFLDYQAEIGVWSPGLSIMFPETLDELLFECERINKTGEMCKERGMRFHYHNHSHEFAVVDGKYMMDIIMERTDPALVDFELDTYWAYRAGLDPLDVMRRYRDRLVLLHQKDCPETVVGDRDLFKNMGSRDLVSQETFMAYKHAEDFTEVGTGIMDIQAIIDLGNELGVKYMTLEQDFSKYPELESIAISKKEFSRFKGIEW